MLYSLKKVLARKFGVGERTEMLTVCIGWSEIK
jgi:hypothetical protein